ncbi:hypothetical protein ABT160_23530 [Streptomyces sp. NPDC001941]|uniref:hypothetical protein n=1 Tax=Streptomyces sp. NPDC001941 TaxID=3154659 RepID=UPI00332F06C7
MPVEGAFVRAQLSPDEVIWSSLDSQLGASTVENLRVTNYLLGALLCAHGAKENPVPEPEPIYRPGVERRQQKQSQGLLSLAERMGATRPRIT